LKTEAKAAIKRWTIVIATVAMIYFFAKPMYFRLSQVSWHLLHRNELRLRQARYTVPWRWLVRHEAAGVFLQDYPLANKTLAVIDIHEGRPNLRHPTVDQYVTMEERFAENAGSLLSIRRFSSAGREIGCVESNAKIGSLVTIFNVICYSSDDITFMYVGDRARVGDFYSILSSAKPL